MAEGEESKFLQALTGTAVAGFLAAQSIGDNAFASHARTLTQTIGQNAQATKTVYAQMGCLHLAVGGFGYLFGFVAASYNLGNDFSNWQQRQPYRPIW